MRVRVTVVREPKGSSPHDALFPLTRPLLYHPFLVQFLRTMFRLRLSRLFHPAPLWMNPVVVRYHVLLLLIAGPNDLGNLVQLRFSFLPPIASDRRPGRLVDSYGNLLYSLLLEHVPVVA